MKKVGIIAHRGGFLPEGPIPEVMDKYTIPENTLEAFQRAFQNGWGVETDVRINQDGSFILIHDANSNRFSRYPKFKIPTLDDLCQLAEGYTKNGSTPFIAFQIKRNDNPSSGAEVGRGVAKKIQQYGLKNSILFDATLEEAQILHDEFPWLNLSVSVGEENYGPTIYTPDQVFDPEFTRVYSSVWADEWKAQGSMYNEMLFEKLRTMYQGRIAVISPELHYNENHPLSKNLEGLKKLWKEIAGWGIASGICSDYPSVLELTLKSSSQ